MDPQFGHMEIGSMFDSLYAELAHAFNNDIPAPIGNKMAEIEKALLLSNGHDVSVPRDS